MSEPVDGEKLLDQPSYFVEHYIGVEPFEYQVEFMDHESNRKAFVSGRRVGKSRTAAWLALHAATSNYNYQVLITAPSQRQSTELFNQVKTEIRQSDIPEDGWGIERSTRTEINFASGSRIKVVPLGTDGSNVRGFGADMLIVDEAAYVEADIFREVLSPMLAFGDGEFILLSTPLGKKGYLWQQWEKVIGRKKNKEGWYGKQVPTSANPGISDDFIEKQKQDLSKSQFKREYLGQFDESSDAFFDPDDLTDDAVALERSVSQEDSVCYLGVDLASTGGDRSVYISVDARGNVFDVEYTEDAPLTEAMSRVRELHNFNDYTKIVIDETGLGEGVVAQLQEDIGDRTVDGFKFSNEKKQSLYNTLKSQLQNEEIRYMHIPNADEPENMMVSELMDLGYSYTSTGKMRIEHPSGGHDDFCLSRDTEILTVDGWKNYDDYSGEDVATYNSGSIEYQSPSREIEKQFDGDMIHLQGNNIDQLVTPNHKVIYEHRGKSDGDVVWKEDYDTASKFSSLSSGTRYSNRRIPATGKRDVSGIDRKDWEMKLMGWMITEGWISEDEYSNRYMIGQSNTEYIDEIENLVSRFNPTKYERDDGCIYWQFHVKDNEYFDKLLSDGIHNIPRNVLTNSSSEQLELLFESMMDGDGTWSRMTYHTKNASLAEQFQELCHKIGYRASIRKVTEDTNFMDGYVGYDVYVISDEAEYARISDVERVEYDDTVWCVTVPNGTIVVRRNGTISVTGNCDSLALAVWAKSQKNIARSDKGSMKPFNLGSLR